VKVLPCIEGVFKLHYMNLNICECVTNREECEDASIRDLQLLDMKCLMGRKASEMEEERF